VSWRLPFAVCGVLMLIALGVAASRLRNPAERQAPVTIANIGRVYRRGPFVALSAVTAAYNFVFFIVLGFTPLFLHLDVVELGLAFTAWGIALALGILVIGHRLAHRIGYVQTVGIALLGLLGCTLLFATSHSLITSLVALTASGLFMGLANANLTDLALGLGSPDRRTTTGAFNVVRWGATRSRRTTPRTGRPRPRSRHRWPPAAWSAS
jgi:predicted MFS family arabinose efflux permease